MNQNWPWITSLGGQWNFGCVKLWNSRSHNYSSDPRKKPQSVFESPKKVLNKLVAHDHVWYSEVNSQRLYLDSFLRKFPNSGWQNTTQRIIQTSKLQCITQHIHKMPIFRKTAVFSLELERPFSLTHNEVRGWSDDVHLSLRSELIAFSFGLLKNCEY